VSYNEGDLFRVSVPSNWRERQSNSTVTFAPDGAYGNSGSQSVFTHGIEIGVARNEAHDLQTATSELIDALAQGNPRLGRASNYQSVNVGDRRGLRATLTNESETTGRAETIDVYTTLLRNGNLLYAIGVAPRDEYRTYEPAFQRVIESLEITNSGQ